MTRLPAEGRKGRTPKWPFSKVNAVESKVWRELWRLPQSVMWEQLGWARTVARYTRCLVTVEGADPSTRMLAEVRQLEDRLGLSPMAMLRLRWEVAVDEVAQAREQRTGASVRRLKAVDPGAVAGA